MAKKKNHYYVLVITSEGPKFVTHVNYSDKTAEWDWEKAPLEMGKQYAEDLVLGLNLNLHQAYTVSYPAKIDCQPYNYDMYRIEWKKREGEEEDDESI